MRDWLQRCFIEEDADLLQRIHKFGRQLIGSQNRPHLKPLAEKLVALSDFKVISYDW
jgi:hypothetical protein